MGLIGGQKNATSTTYSDSPVARAVQQVLQALGSEADLLTALEALYAKLSGAGKESAIEAAQAGLVPSLCIALSNFVENRDIVKVCGDVIATMCSHGVRELVVEAGAAPHLVSALVHYRGDAELTNALGLAIGNTALGEPHTVDALVAAGAAAAVVSGLATAATAACLDNCLFAIRNIAAGGDGPVTALMEADAPRVISMALQHDRISARAATHAATAVASMALKQNAHRAALSSSGVIRACAAAAQRFIDDAGMVNMGLLAAANTALGGESTKEQCSREGVIEAAVAALARHPTIETLVDNTLFALRNISASESDTVTARVMSAGAAEAIARALKEARVTDRACSHACNALASLALRAGPNRDALAAKGVIPAVARALRQHMQNVDAATAGVLAIGNIALGSDATKRAIADTDAVAAVVAVLNTQPTDGALLDNALFALRNVSAGDDKCVAAVMAAGSVQAIVRNLGASSLTARAAGHGCSTLASVSVREDAHRAAVANAGGVQAAAAILRRFGDHVSTTSVAALAIGNTALRLTGDGSMYTSASGTVGAVVSALRPEVLADAGAIDNCLFAIRNIASRGQENVRELVEAGVLPLLASALKAPAASVRALGHACGVLAYVSLNDNSLRQRVVDAGCVPPLVAMLKAHKTSAAAVSSAALALGNTALGPTSIKVAITTAGAAPTIIQGLQSVVGEADGAQIDNILFSLRNLAAGNEACTQAIIFAGGPGVISAALQSPRIVARGATHGCVALASLSLSVESNRDAVLAAGGMVAVAAVAQRFGSEDSVMDAVALAAGNTAWGSAVRKTAVVETGVVDALRAARARGATFSASARSTMDTLLADTRVVGA